MRILHYALGLPQYRSGGLTKYVVDLMREQKRQGHQTAILWPGRMKLVNKKVSIRKQENEFISFEMINPLPVPLLQGVADIPAYTAKCDEKVFLHFFEDWMPDVIEIHTFMGLYEEFVSAAKKLRIPMVFVTHDYYALCPKVNLLHGNDICEEGMADERCSRCNLSGAPLSMKKIYLMQSPVYRLLKDSKILKMMRKDYKRKQSRESIAVERIETKVFPYHVLRKYYMDMLNKMDSIHANSSLAANIYQKLGCVRNVTVLPISNAGIGDYREAKSNGQDSTDILQLLYLGPASVYKGFFLLTEVLDMLWDEGVRNFRLHLYGVSAENKPYIDFHDSFSREQLQGVYGNADLTLVPSLWKETFGFVVAESLSFGTPVLVTEHVGAKDLVKDCVNGFCIKADKESLATALRKFLGKEEVRSALNQGVEQGEAPLTMEKHVQDLQVLLESVIRKKESVE